MVICSLVKMLEYRIVSLGEQPPWAMTMTSHFSRVGDEIYFKRLVFDIKR
jgi:hypothetical protein